MLLAIAVLTLQLEARQSTVATGASIEGTVVDTTTGRPIPGVRLALGTPIPGRPALSVTSDADGHFVLTGVPAGSHRVTTTKDGYAPAKPAARKTPGAGLTFTVTRDQQVRGVLIRLVPHGVITGKVIDTNGSPVVGAMAIAVRSFQALPGNSNRGERIGGIQFLETELSPLLVGFRRWPTIPPAPRDLHDEPSAPASEAPMNGRRRP
jgi:hypothetical protein